MKRFKRKIHNFCLKATAAFMVFVLLLSIYSINPHSWLPFIPFFLSLLWLFLFAYVNGMTVLEGGRKDVYY